MASSVPLNVPFSGKFEKEVVNRLEVKLKRL